MSEEEGEVVNVGWVSLSRSGRSLTIRVMDQMFFVPLHDLQKVLNEDVFSSIAQLLKIGVVPAELKHPVKMLPAILNAAALPQNDLLIQKLPRRKLHWQPQARILHHAEPLEKTTQNPSIIYSDCPLYFLNQL